MPIMSKPKSNLGIKRVPFLVFRGLKGNLNPKKGNKGLLWVLHVDPGSYFEFYKVIPKRNYYGAYG